MANVMLLVLIINHAAANIPKAELYISPSFQTAVLGDLIPLASSLKNKRYWKEIYLFATLKKNIPQFLFLSHISW